MPRADEVIEGLGLQPHPERGWYAETWRAPAADGERPTSGGILYLLRRGERSRWHRVDADEIWQFSAGDPLDLRVVARPGSAVEHHRLGVDFTRGEKPQVVVPAGAWQAASPLGA